MILDRLSRRMKLSRARITSIAIHHFNEMPDETKFRVIANASTDEPKPRRTKS